MVTAKHWENVSNLHCAILCIEYTSMIGCNYSRDVSISICTPHILTFLSIFLGKTALGMITMGEHQFSKVLTGYGNFLGFKPVYHLRYF